MMSGGSVGKYFVSGSTASNISINCGSLGVGGPYISASKAQSLDNNGDYIGSKYVLND